MGPKPPATQVPGVFPEPWEINSVRAACQAWGLLPAPDLCYPPEPALVLWSFAPVLLEGVTPRVATGTISPFLPGVISGWLVMVVPTNSHEFLGFPVRVIGCSLGVTPAAIESLCGGAVGSKPSATQESGVFPEPWVTNLVLVACQAWGLLPAPDPCSSPESACGLRSVAPVLLEGVTPREVTGAISPFLPGVISGWLDMVVPTNSREFLGTPLKGV